MSEKLREAQKRRIQALSEATGRDLTALARGAKLTPSTLTRFMNNTDAKHALSASTFDKLERAYGQILPLDNERQLPIDLRIKALQAVANALSVTPAVASLLTERQREWLEAVEKLPATAEDQALNMVRVIGEAGIAANQQSSPSESSRRRRRS